MFRDYSGTGGLSTQARPEHAAGLLVQVFFMAWSAQPFDSSDRLFLRLFGRKGILLLGEGSWLGLRVLLCNELCWMLIYEGIF